MNPPKKFSKPLVVGPTELEIQELPDKEFKVIVLQMLIELQEYTDNLMIQGNQ